MSCTDDLTRDLSDLLAGHYDSMDRISLNGFFHLGSTSGGLLKWWNALTGGQPLTEEKLRAFAGTFSRRVRAWGTIGGIAPTPSRFRRGRRGAARRPRAPAHPGLRPHLPPDLRLRLESSRDVRP